MMKKKLKHGWNIVFDDSNKHVDKMERLNNNNPILDKRIFVLRPCSVTLVLPPLDSEMGWTGELWSKTKFIILEN